MKKIISLSLVVAAALAVGYSTGSAVQYRQDKISAAKTIDSVQKIFYAIGFNASQEQF